MFDCVVGEAEALLVVYDDGSVDVTCPRYHGAKKCSGPGGSECPYKKY